MGSTALELGQLKILQEVITLTVFVPFAVFYMHQPLSLRLNYLWAARRI
ncbi:MAG: DMT family protein [Pirellulaceae bacterium]